MRIMIFAAGGDIGGGKTHILSLARELSRENDLRLVCFRKGVMSSEAAEMGIDVVYVDHKEGYARAIRFALDHCDSFRPQLIHCHGAKANAIGIIVKKLRGVPVMTTVHSDPKLDYMGAPLRKYTFGVINGWALRRMDYYVAVAWRMRQLLIDRGFDPQSIFTLYNGMDFSGASEEPRPFKDEKDPIVVGIAARLDPVKDIPTLMKAFAMAYAKDKRLRLSIAGIGDEEAKLRGLAKELGIEDVTVFEGWISDIKAYFARVDINVLSSLSETFPYSLLEGAYDHCPAIASNVGGIPSLVINEETGLMFEAGDAELFSRHILRLAADQQLRRDLAEALFKKAKSEFSLERMRQDQQHIYETLIRRHELKGKRRGAVLCGAYGKGNVGDEAILTAILSSLRTIDEDMPFWVMSRDPKQTSKSHGVGSFYIFNVPRFIKALRRSEIFVNGGGSLIQDITSSRSLYFYLFTLWAAKKLGCSVIMYGCGIGPVIKARDRRIAAKVLNSTADVISLRDSGSEELLKEIGVTKPRIIRAADPVVNLPRASEDAVDRAFKAEGIPGDGRMIGFCLRKWPGFAGLDQVAEAARYAYERYGLTPVFFPIEHPTDVAIGEAVAGMLQCPGYVCTRKHSASEAIGMLGRMDLVCGMRLHSLIFATAAGTPVIGISYDVKVDSFIRDIGSDACLPAEGLKADELKALIDKKMSEGRGASGKACERLRQLEKGNAEEAARLLAMRR
ncbi:MAG: polysaccharide pyruvyl transferase CsaB [Firmicutes bacterium]|nr:polysaccharide pyruvyl transferase CsaB [Bacillota bacterium]